MGTRPKNKQAWVDVLRTSVCRFNRYKATVGEGFGVDLSGADLSGLDLSKAELSFCNLSHCSFRNSVIPSHAMVTCRLEGVDLEGATGGSALDMAVLEQICLLWRDPEEFNRRRRAVAPLTPADRMRRSRRIQETDRWDEAVGTLAMPLANFSGADLGDADLSDLMLGGANLEGTDLSRCTLDHTFLTNAFLQGARFGGTLRYTDLSRADLSGAVFDETCLSFVHADECFAEAASFRRAELHSVMMRDARLERACFDGARLNTFYLSGANLRSASLRGAVIERARMFQTLLVGCDLRGAAFRGGEMDMVDVDGADLRDATFEGMSTFNLVNADRTRRE